MRLNFLICGMGTNSYVAVVSIKWSEVSKLHCIMASTQYLLNNVNCLPFLYLGPHRFSPGIFLPGLHSLLLQ